MSIAYTKPTQIFNYEENMKKVDSLKKICYYILVRNKKGNDMRAIYLDMDGTINQFYSYPSWLSLLQAENVKPYEKCAPIHGIDELNDILCEFAALGVTIGVISWGAINSSKEYTKAVRKAKIAWCKKYLTCITEFHVVKYGTPKHTTAKIKDSILVDDNADVRNAWKNGATIDASNSEEMIKNLRQLLDMMKAA